MTGRLAVSLAGHDKDSLFLILREEKDSVYLADGVSRLYASPKRKNRKHIQTIEKAGMDQAALAALARNPADADTKIKRCIKLYVEKFK
ncbi:MAG: KOW domain-containing RNA-binding protein [Eubacteriales bacterium]|nr:KOW domain-containing RNA-binding protein [Eubacteriales bacterium]